MTRPGNKRNWNSWWHWLRTASAKSALQRVRRALVHSELAVELLEDRSLLAVDVTGMVFQDLDGNHVRDPGEVGIAGAVVELRSVGVDGSANTADDLTLDYQITAADGTYSFLAALGAQYYLNFRAPVSHSPSAFTFSSQNVGADTTVDSDVNSTGQTAVFTTSQSDLDAGLSGTLPTYGWAANIGGSGADQGRAIAIAADGSVYVVGSFRSSASFYQGPGSYSLSVSGSNDTAYVAKYSAAGALIWAKATQGSGTAVARGVAVDADGNVFVVGEFTGTTDFDPSSVVSSRSATGTDAFVWKLDAQGNLLWARSTSNPTSNTTQAEIAHAVSVDENGDVYVVGAFTGTADFDPGSDPLNLASNNNDAFVWKLSSAGDFQWAKKTTTTNNGNEFAYGVTVDGSSVYIVGSISAATDFDPTTGAIEAPASSTDAFVWKLGTDGSFQWVKKTSGGGTETANGVSVDSAGNIYIVGTFFGTTVDFDPGAGTLQRNSGNNDAFVWKLSSAGELLWVRATSPSSNSSEYAHAVAIDVAGNVYVTGYFNGTNADFDPGSGSLLLTSGNDDAFVWKLDTEGNFLWVEKTLATSTYEKGYGIATDSVGNAYIVGEFNGATDFAPGSATASLATSTYNAFAWKLSNPPLTVSGRVFADDDDGIQESGEAGIAGATVKLYAAGSDGEAGTADDLLVATHVTLADGTYHFSAPAGAKYSLEVIPPTGATFSFSPRLAGSDTALDSDVGATGRTELFSASQSALDAGLVGALAPTIALSAAPADPVNTSIIVTATLSKLSLDFTADDLLAVNGSISEFSGSGAVYTFRLTPAATGDFSVSVAANAFSDTGGIFNSEGASLTRTADLTAPTVELASSSPNLVNGSIVVTATLSEVSADFSITDISTTNGEITEFVQSGNVYTFRLTPTAEGAFSVEVIANAFSDATGNFNTSGDVLTRTADWTPPTVELASSSPDLVNGSIVVTATLSEASADFTVDDLTTTNGEITDFVQSGNVYTFRLTPTAEGNFSVDVNANAFSDATGNFITAGDSLTRTADWTAPTVDLTSSSLDLVSGSVVVTATLSEASADFTVDDLSTTNGEITEFVQLGNVYTFRLTPIAEGAFSVEVSANAFSDATGNFNTAGDLLTRTADWTTPTVELTSSSPNLVNGSVVVTATLSEGSTDFTLADLTTTNGEITEFVQSGNVYTFRLTPTAEGVFSVELIANAFSDATGNFNTVGDSLDRTADWTAPIVELASSSPNLVNGSIVVTATLSEASADFTLADLTTTNGEITEFVQSGNVYTFRLTPTAEGGFSVEVNANAFSDATGNFNTVGDSLDRTADWTAPTVELASSSPDLVNGSIVVTATLSEASADFTLADLTTTNGEITEFVQSGNVYTFRLTPVAEGAFSVEVSANAFSDATGNFNTAGDSLDRTADWTAPTVELASSSPDLVSGSIVVTATLSEASADFTLADLTTTNGEITEFVQSGNVYTFRLTPVAEGAFSVEVSANAFSDATGNFNTSGDVLTRTADWTAPTVALTSSSPDLVNGSVVVMATLSEASADFTVDDLTTANGEITEFVQTGNSYTFRLTPVVEGAFSVEVSANAFSDATGNFNTSGDVLTRTADWTPPTIEFASSAPDLVNGSIVVTVTLSEAILDFSIDDITTTNGEISEFSGSALIYTFRLTPAADGPFSVSVDAERFRDVVGNWNPGGPLISGVANLASGIASGANAIQDDPLSAAIVLAQITHEANAAFAERYLPSANARTVLYQSSVPPTLELSQAISSTSDVGLPKPSEVWSSGNSSPVRKLRLTRDSTAVPTVSLTAPPAQIVDGPITIIVSMSGHSGQFTAQDLLTTNGEISQFRRQGGAYTFILTPIKPGPFSVSIKPGVLHNPADAAPADSTTVTRTYQASDAAEPMSSLIPTGAAFSLAEKWVRTLHGCEWLVGDWISRADAMTETIAQTAAAPQNRADADPRDAQSAGISVIHTAGPALGGRRISI